MLCINFYWNEVLNKIKQSHCTHKWSFDCLGSNEAELFLVLLLPANGVEIALFPCAFSKFDRSISHIFPVHFAHRSNKILQISQYVILRKLNVCEEIWDLKVELCENNFTNKMRKYVQLLLSRRFIEKRRGNFTLTNFGLML